jgi:hypothetical protein
MRKGGSPASTKNYIKYPIDDTFFEKIDTPNKAYILGLLFSDGHMYERRKQIRLKMADKELLESVLSAMKYDRPLLCEKGYGNHQDAWSLIICNPKMYEDLINIGLLPRKTYESTFPVDFISDENMSHFIRGFFDGDGSIGSYKHIGGYLYYCASITKSKSILNPMVQFLYSKGIVLNANNDKRKDSRIGTCRVRSIDGLIKLYDFMYSGVEDSICLQRKYSKFKECNEYLRSRPSLKKGEAHGNM